MTIVSPSAHVDCAGETAASPPKWLHPFAIGGGRRPNDGRNDALAWHMHLERGPADDVIPHMVRTFDIDLPVMGTIARAGLDGVFIGNTAERILDEVRCWASSRQVSCRRSPRRWT